MLLVQVYVISLLLLNCFVPSGKADQNCPETPNKHTLQSCAGHTHWAVTWVLQEDEGKSSLGNQITNSFHHPVQQAPVPQLWSKRDSCGFKADMKSSVCNINDYVTMHASAWQHECQSKDVKRKDQEVQMCNIFDNFYIANNNFWIVN